MTTLMDLMDQTMSWKRRGEAWESGTVYGLSSGNMVHLKTAAFITYAVHRSHLRFGTWTVLDELAAIAEPPACSGLSDAPSQAAPSHHKESMYAPTPPVDD